MSVIFALVIAPISSFAQAGGTSATTVSISGSNSAGYISSGNYSTTMNDPSEVCFAIAEDLVGNPHYASLSVTLGNNNIFSNYVEPLTVSVPPGYFGPGTYNATASFSGYDGSDEGGDDCVVTGSSASASFTVAGPIGSQTTLVGPAQPVISGQSVSLLANVTPPSSVVVAGSNPTGTVTIFHGEQKLATGPINSTITLPSAGIPAGTYSITAAYSGDINYLPSTSTGISITVTAKQSTATVLTVTPNPLVLGNSVQLLATVTPTPSRVSATGTVTFAAGALVLGTTPVTTTTSSSAMLMVLAKGIPTGTYAVVAKYSGDAANQASTSAPVSVTVQAQSATTTAVSIQPSTTLVQGQPTNLQVIVTQVTGDTAPTGTVQVLVNGQVAAGLPLNGGAASIALSTNGEPAGNYSVTAKYEGSATDVASTSPTQQVTLLAATATSVSASPNPVTQGAATILTAAVVETQAHSVPSGEITFSYQGNVLGTATLGSNGVTTLPLETSGFSSGTYLITAAYSGDDGNGASSGTVSLVVQ